MAYRALLLFGFLSALGFAGSPASAGQCASGSYGSGATSICRGDTVYLLNDYGDPRIGTVEALFANGKAKISYYYNYANNELWRNVSQLSPKVRCLDEICEGTEVNLKSDYGDDREGVVTSLFANGQVQISYFYNGADNIIWRKLSQLKLKLSHAEGLGIGDTVLLKNDYGDFRVGTIQSIYSDLRTKIEYYYNGSQSTLFRNASQISKSVTCVDGGCVGDQVYLVNDYGDPREGTINHAFANGWLQISYYYNGSANTIWRKVGQTADSVYCLIQH